MSGVCLHHSPPYFLDTRSLPEPGSSPIDRAADHDSRDLPVSAVPALGILSYGFSETKLRTSHLCSRLYN